MGEFKKRIKTFVDSVVKDTPIAKKSIVGVLVEIVEEAKLEFPDCRRCKYFRLDNDPSSNHYGIPDTCEDALRETWEDNSNQPFFLCNPIREWFKRWVK